jgi:hypothetical protein
MRERGRWGDAPRAAGSATTEQEIEALEQDASYLERCLEEVKDRLGALEKAPRKEKG